MQDELLITDMRCALPTDAWTDGDCTVTRPISAPSAGKWRIIDYQATNYSGSMIHTVFPDAAPLRIPLGRTGWHAVSIGMSAQAGSCCDSFVEVRLTGNTRWDFLECCCPTNVQLKAKGTNSFFGGPLHEQPWMLADLTGRDLEIRYPVAKPRVCNGWNCVVFSVRAVPVRPEDVPALTTRRRRRLAHGCAALPPYYGNGFDDGQWDVVYYDHPGTDVVLWPSKVGSLAGAGAWDVTREFRWQPILQEVHAMIARGEDPLQGAIDRAHTHGKRFWMGLRPQSWVAPPPLHQIFRSPFFTSHPEFRCLDAEGTALGQLSVAFPPVRKRLGALLAETLDRGADGVVIACHRGHPLVRYEAPVQARFRELFGTDVRGVPDLDARLQQVWAEFVTQWMRELRRLLDEAGPTALGRRELAIITGPDLAWNRRLGLDVEAWAREGLVDVVMPFPRRTPFTAQTSPCSENDDLQDGAVDVPAYSAAVQGTAMQVIPCLGHYGDRFVRYPWSGVSVPPRAELLRNADRYYAAGAAGLCCGGDDLGLTGARLEDPEVMRLWSSRYLPPQGNSFKSVADVCVDRNPPGIGS
ncbi:MAG: family 10 glycosylhydrolase [Kiritimatiellae bacterium]|nr:family 10 glycosylhydrolase [Kiritimatiellia bacterium]